MANEVKHSISISDKLYKDIKEYCSLNDLKINSFVEDLVARAFRVEKFGAAPFAKEKHIQVILPVVQEDKRAEELFNEIVEGAGGPDAFNDEIRKLIMGPSAEEIKEQTAEIAGNIPQETEKVAEEIPQKEDIAREEVQKTEEIAPKTVQKGNKKITRLN